MKTILVIYTDKFKEDTTEIKRYIFNADGPIRIGDLLKTNVYRIKLQVVKILDQTYKYYNSETGDLSATFTGSKQFEIKTMKIVDEIVENQILAWREDQS